MHVQGDVGTALLQHACFQSAVVRRIWLDTENTSLQHACFQGVDNAFVEGKLATALCMASQHAGGGTEQH